jgi:hypothetical protein
MQFYPYCVLGVFASIILPIFRQWLPSVGTTTIGINRVESRLSEFWRIAKPYLAIGVVSLFAALIVLAIAGDVSDIRTAVLLGYASDSTLQKFSKSEYVVQTTV